MIEVLKEKDKRGTIICLLIFAVVLIGFGIYMIMPNKIDREGIETEAVVTRVEYAPGQTYQKVRSCYAKITVDGKEYEYQLDFYDGGVREGDVYKVKHLPEDPSKFIVPKNEYSLWSIFVLLGGIGFAISIPAYIYVSYKKMHITE